MASISPRSRPATNTTSPCAEFATFRADFDARPELIPIWADGRPIRYGQLVQGVCLSQQVSSTRLRQT